MFPPDYYGWYFEDSAETFLKDFPLFPLIASAIAGAGISYVFSEITKLHRQTYADATRRAETLRFQPALFAMVLSSVVWYGSTGAVTRTIVNIAALVIGPWGIEHLETLLSYITTIGFVGETGLIYQATTGDVQGAVLASTVSTAGMMVQLVLNGLWIDVRLNGARTSTFWLILYMFFAMANIPSLMYGNRHMIPQFFDEFSNRLASQYEQLSFGIVPHWLNKNQSMIGRIFYLAAFERIVRFAGFDYHFNRIAISLANLLLVLGVAHATVQTTLSDYSAGYYYWHWSAFVLPFIPVLAVQIIALGPIAFMEPVTFYQWFTALSRAFEAGAVGFLAVYGYNEYACHKSKSESPVDGKFKS